MMHVILFLVVTAIKYFFKISNYCLYNVIVVPISFFIFYFGININNSKIYNLFHSKIFKYLSNISYVFFLAQFFTWDLYRLIKKTLNMDLNNFGAFLLSLFICMLITIIMYELMVKPLSKIMKTKMLKKIR